MLSISSALLTAAVFQFLHGAAQGISCLDNKGNHVDWYTVYKMPEAYAPHRKKHIFPPHLYMDSNSPSWTMSSEGVSLNISSQAVGYTLGQVYTNYGSSGVGYFLYNDEKPAAAGGTTTVKHAHAKGVFAVDSHSGFWLVHSVPKFPPPANGSYAYPPTGMEYGQHFLCVSIATSDFDHIGYQLRVDDVWLYDTNWPDQLHNLSANLVELNKKQRLANGTTSDVLTFQSTLPSAAFVSFSKSAKYGHDLYDSLVAPGLKTSLFVETWNHGPATMNINSSCETQYQVENIMSIASVSLGISFPTFQDHSKFAVSNSSHYVCIGDINRQVAQLKRGGGTVCFRDAQVWTAYNGLVAQVQACPLPQPKTRLQGEL